jgi:crossover junction endodeoxyribonuclease RuvC
MIILGIDPGTAICGYGVIEKEGNRFRLLDYGTVRSSSEEEPAARLHTLFLGLDRIIDKYKPKHMAVEELFFNKNVRTALVVGQARGVILLAGQLRGLSISEYTPLQVKQAVVGYGRAEKQQVQFMVKAILNMSEIPKPDDAADALAIAICHGNTCRGGE